VSAAPGKTAGGATIPRKYAEAWRFPACDQCAQHVARWQSAAGFARWFRFVGLAVAVILMIRGGFGALLAGVVLAFGLAALAGYVRRREARAQCHPECAWGGPPVFYLGPSAEGFEAFEFAQPGYAGDFMRANLKKVRNLSADAMRLIQSDLDRAAAEEAEKKAIERERVRIAAEVAHDKEAFEKCMARIEAAKGPAGRRSAVEAGLRSLRQDHMREQLLLEASRIEVSAALAKAEGLKSPAAKVRTLSEALDSVRNDPVPDHLQLELIRSLESAIAKIQDEKNSIDMV
jgi:hypothetical protein